MKKARQILYLIILIFSLNVSNVLAADNIKNIQHRMWKSVPIPQR